MSNFKTSIGITEIIVSTCMYERKKCYVKYVKYEKRVFPVDY